MKRLILTLLLFVAAGNIFAQTAKVDTVVTQKWNGTAWVDTSRAVYTYNADCQLTNLLLQDWDATSQTWVNSFQTNFTYISGNYLSESISQTWNKNTSTWKNLIRNTYTYDGSFKVLT